VLQCAAVCRSVLQCVAVCCSVLQCVAVWCSVLQCDSGRETVTIALSLCCSVLQCVAVCCSMMQCGLWVTIALSVSQAAALRRCGVFTHVFLLCVSMKKFASEYLFHILIYMNFQFVSSDLFSCQQLIQYWIVNILNSIMGRHTWVFKSSIASVVGWLRLVGSLKYVGLVCKRAL